MISPSRRSSSTSTCCGRSMTRSMRPVLVTRPIHYAVKANPAPEVVAALAAKGAHFDCASRGEIELCLGQGVAPSHIAFGNTIKRASDIAFAHSVGVSQFAVDAEDRAAQDRRERAGIAGDRAHADRGERGRLAAQPQVRLLASRSPASDGSGSLPRPRRGGHLLPRRQPDARADDVARWRSTPRYALWEEGRGAWPRAAHRNIGGGFPAFYGQPMPRTRPITPPA